MLGPLLLNIDLIDLFLECENNNITSYADDTSPYSCAQDLSTVTSEFKELLKKFNWCKNNNMKDNHGK